MQNPIMQINPSVLIMMVAAILLLLGVGLGALTANREIPIHNTRHPRRFPVAAGVRIYKGAFVGKTPNGYAKPFVPGDEYLGPAYGEADNSSGSAGDVDVDVDDPFEFEHTLTGVSPADVGRAVFATDDGALALSGHPDAFVGRVRAKVGTNTALIRHRSAGEKPADSDTGCYELAPRYYGYFEPTGAASASKYYGGMEHKSILGLGVFAKVGADGGVTGEFDNTAEVALASIRGVDAFLVSKGITMELDFVLSDKGDAAALDFDIGLGTLLTANSEANIDHADMVDLIGLHMDGNSDNILVQSDNNTTDVAATDTGVDNDSAEDTLKNVKIIVRPSGECEVWIAGARVNSDLALAVRNNVALAPFVNMEKTSDDTTAKFIVRNLRVAGAKA